jgi:leucyl-tRNA synthetase
VAVPREELPVLLPEVEDFKPKGKPPLAQAEDWVNVTCPTCGGPGKRETETMDTFVDSSWYFLRYCDPHNDAAPYDRAIVDFWGPVDHYTGGIDHTTMHLIYARFFQKALADLDLVGFREPFQRFFANGWVTSGGTKMGKRAGNVTGPDEMVERYGADAIRAYILFLGPADQDMEWTEEGVEGMVRFMRRLWRVVHEVVESAPASGPGDSELARKAHATIARASDDIGRRAQFHTPIAAVMELVNDLSKDSSAADARFAAETAVSLIQPYAPHIAEELWETLGHERLWQQAWPAADLTLLERDTFELVVQVNGKVRDRFEVETGLPEDELVARALQSDKVRVHVDGKQVRQTIVVPDKLVNVVVA